MAIQGIGTTMYQWDREYRQRGLAFDDHLEEAFGEMAAVGLDGIEPRLMYADTPEKADAFARLCKRVGLRIGSFYGNCKLYDEDELEHEVEQFVSAGKAAKRTGCSLITCNLATAPGGRDKTNEELAVQAQGLTAIGEQLGSLGIRVAIHNHTPEMRHDAREFRYMMGHVKSGAIGVALCVGWATIAGVSPVDLIHEVHDRLFDIHVRNVMGDWWTQSVPEGTVSYAQILDLLERYKYDGWLMVELDLDDRVELTRSFRDNILRSTWYLKGMLARPTRTDM